jgi:23S rRNA (cytosine1962-C5)-methyltransferase
VRILQLGVTELPVDFWQTRLERAKNLRQELQLLRTDNTAYRLIHGAGDDLPGLIIDIYGTVAVVQCHSNGMFREREAIATALREVYGDQLSLIYNKSGSSLSKTFVTDAPLAGALFGELPEEGLIIKENGNRFSIDFRDGQKTGFFLDQRDNRALLGKYAAGKKVLNTFCYTGGFSVYALAAGAQSVTSVDLSAAAMEITDANVALLGAEATQKHQSVTADVLEYLKEEDQQYDIVVVDPPAYAKNKNRRHKAVQAYKRLNARAMQTLRPGGLLFTFSCSQVVDRELFGNTIVAAGLESGRPCSILHTLSQGVDHPTNLFHPEGSYLKGLVVRVG